MGGGVGPVLVSSPSGAPTRPARSHDVLICADPRDGSAVWAGVLIFVLAYELAHFPFALIFVGENLYASSVAFDVL